jgi:hypothetical protein
MKQMLTKTLRIAALGMVGFMSTGCAQAGVGVYWQSNGYYPAYPRPPVVVVPAPPVVVYPPPAVYAPVPYYYTPTHGLYEQYPPRAYVPAPVYVRPRPWYDRDDGRNHDHNNYNHYRR